jgi:hypothetical protein
MPGHQYEECSDDEHAFSSWNCHLVGWIFDSFDFQMKINSNSGSLICFVEHQRDALHALQVRQATFICTLAEELTVLNFYR